MTKMRAKKKVGKRKGSAKAKPRRAQARKRTKTGSRGHRKVLNGPASGSLNQIDLIGEVRDEGEEAWLLGEELGPGEIEEAGAEFGSTESQSASATDENWRRRCAQSDVSGVPDADITPPED